MSILNIFKKKNNNNESDLFLSPTNGEILELSSVPDEVFSQKMMGDGFAMKSTDGDIFSPVNGTIEMIFDTKHAIGIKSDNGKEILIHLGVDTVNLKGQGFKVFVETGQKVKAGDLLIHMDVEFIRNNAKSDLSPVIFTNLEESEYISFVPKKIFSKEKDIISIKRK